MDWSKQATSTPASRFRYGTRMGILSVHTMIPYQVQKSFVAYSKSSWSKKTLAIDSQVSILKHEPALATRTSLVFSRPSITGWDVHVTTQYQRVFDRLYHDIVKFCLTMRYIRMTEAAAMSLTIYHPTVAAGQDKWSSWLCTRFTFSQPVSSPSPLLSPLAAAPLFLPRGHPLPSLSSRCTPYPALPSFPAPPRKETVVLPQLPHCSLLLLPVLRTQPQSSSPFRVWVLRAEVRRRRVRFEFRNVSCNWDGFVCLEKEGTDGGPNRRRRLRVSIWLVILAYIRLQTLRPLVYLSTSPGKPWIACEPGLA